ncbi:restriction endonuclease subunit S [Kocuria rhizosphaericola]|uniref:restriction endonuclease subunit S n=1 Tax=Kocuria rhizosphaericola TaxID=3376284 RepID=UPI00378F8DF7
MSRVDELIREYCPSGVPFYQLSDVSRSLPGLNGKTKADFSDGNARYVSYKNAFANIAVDQSATDLVKVGPNERQNSLQLGDVIITGSSESLDDVGMSSIVDVQPDEPIYLNSFCFIIRFDDSSMLLPGFSKYLFRGEFVRSQIRRAASGVTRINVSKPRFMKIRIPVPPPEVQQEIVQVLDQFTRMEANLEADLKAELAARRRQYEHYRLSLIKFDGKVEWASLGDIATIGTGSHDTKDAVLDGEYVFYARGRQPLRLDSFDFDERAIITAGDGVGVGKVFHFANGRYALHQRAYRIVPNEGVDARYIYHYLVADFSRYLERTSVHASVTSLRRPMFLKYSVPLPSLPEQLRISTMLDKFDALVNDLSIGLTAELAARRKQYKHYRDMLLTFEELPS